jgi:hypothetical protein
MNLQDVWNYLTGNEQQRASGRRKIEGTTTTVLAGWRTPSWKGIFEGGTDIWAHSDKQPYQAQARLSMPRHWESVIGSQYNNSGEAFHIQYQADMMDKANAMLHVPNGA